MGETTTVGTICVYGAGAVGGHLAGRLGAVGAEVSLVTRGPQLEAIRRTGLRVETTDGVLESRPLAVSDPAQLGVQDLVIVCVKAPALPAIARSIAPLLHDGTLVLVVGNGIPWWYLHGTGGPAGTERIDRLDPGGALDEHIASRRIVGGVAYTACTVLAPGVIRSENARNRLVIGRPDGRPDPRLETFADLLAPSGVDVAVTPRIRDAIWAKLVLNMVGGALGVLTASPMGAVLAEAPVREFASMLAAEGAAIARAYDCDPGDPVTGLDTLARSTHLQSIVQDLVAGRPMEIDALLRVPLDLARAAGVPTPSLDVIVALAVHRARAAGLYEGD